MSRTEPTIASLAAYYEKHLTDDVMAFWDARTLDAAHGGFLVSFDRAGQLTGSDKNTWCQGRQTYLYSALYHQLEARPHWLEFARSGRDFLVKRAYRGAGRFHYLLDRAGNLKEAAPSAYTDAFALAGLAAFAEASPSDEDFAILRATFETLQAHVQDPAFREYHHFQMVPGRIYHGPHMVGLWVAQVARPVLGAEVVAPFADYCLDRILNVFAKAERRALFEALAPDGAVLATPDGQTLNPGHALESAWFCMHEALERNDAALLARAVEVAGWSYALGHDAEHGGLLAFVNPNGDTPPLYADDATDWGERWDDKIWWVHSEALYAMALAALEGGDLTAWDRFLHLHAYCREHFADPEYGEWYTYLNRDGTPRDTDKGNWIRCAFHVPRNLLMLTLLLKRHASEEPPCASS